MSAVNINRVTVTGNLTRDPELRTIGGEDSNVKVCEMRIAVNARRKQGEEWVDRPNYFDVAVWGARGELCRDWLHKGRGVAIDGRLEWREWDGKDGKHHEAVTIVADNVQFLWPRPAPRKEPEAEGETGGDLPGDGAGLERREPVAVAAAEDEDDGIPF